MLLSLHQWTFPGLFSLHWPFKQTFKAIVLFSLITLSYNTSSLEREPGCVEFCVCFLFPGVTSPLPLISAPSTVYLSFLSAAGKEIEHPRPDIPDRVSLFSMMIFQYPLF